MQPRSNLPSDGTGPRRAKPRVPTLANEEKIGSGEFRRTPGPGNGSVPRKKKRAELGRGRVRRVESNRGSRGVSLERKRETNRGNNASSRKKKKGALPPTRKAWRPSKSVLRGDRSRERGDKRGEVQGKTKELRTLVGGGETTTLASLKRGVKRGE